MTFVVLETAAHKCAIEAYARYCQARKAKSKTAIRPSQNHSILEVWNPLRNQIDNQRSEEFILV